MYDQNSSGMIDEILNDEAKQVDDDWRRINHVLKS